MNFKRRQHKHKQVENKIGEEGARALSEAVKANTSIVSLFGVQAPQPAIYP